MLDWAINHLARIAVAARDHLTMPLRYGLVFVLIAIATGVRLAIAPQEAGLPYVTYFPAATLAAIFGGLGPATLATGLGAFVAAFLFIPPFNTLALDPTAIMSALVFCLDELIICIAVEALRRASAQVAQAHRAEHEARLAAEKASEAKSRFLAAASHDLRQPYQALRLFLGALESDNLTPERRREIVGKMGVAMSAGEELLTALLDISTLDAGVVVARPANIHLGDMIAELEAQHRPTAEAKGLRLRTRGVQGCIWADHALLNRIMGNLVSNAIRYTERGGILIACRRRSGRPVIEVWDSGVGIAAEHQQKVFEEFYQIGNPERDRTKGVGLGLAVVARSANLIGAELTLRSIPGRGTLFRLALPGGGTECRDSDSQPSLVLAV